MTAIGDLRERDGSIEVFDGRAWSWYVDVPEGHSAREVMVALSAPLDATPGEIARWSAKL